MINTKTQIIAGIADGVSDKATIMYNKSIQNLKLNSIYLAFSLKNIEYAVKAIKSLNFLGATISMPFKEKVINYLDKISKEAKDIGAINTVVNKNGLFIGYNTDFIGAIQALKKKTSLKNKKVILIGAGGVAKAIAYGLNKEGCKVIILNRTLNKAKKLAKRYNFEFASLKELKNIKKYDIIINATSVGFKNNKKIIDKSFIRKNKVLMDVVFDPVETQLIKDAKRKKCKIVTGLDMLIYQAIAQFELFYNKKPSFNILKKGYNSV
ncbi:MAG: shikimate dehydrogenase [Nanoarchaeota archaeon]